MMNKSAKQQVSFKLMKASVLFGFSVLTGCVSAAKAPLASYVAEIKTQGSVSSFRGGTVYRGEAPCVRLSVSGSHYEMGLQYGVLLAPEIESHMAFLDNFMKDSAKAYGVPASMFVATIKKQAIGAGARLPQKYKDEIRGAAEGSGLSYERVMMATMIYDCLSLGCTSVVMNGQGGQVIHGRNQDVDSFGGNELSKHSIIVRYNPAGGHAVTAIGWPLFFGVQTGSSDAGLAFSEETYTVKKSNPSGLSAVYLAREMLETATGLEQALGMLEGKLIMGASGCVVSDRKNGAAAHITMLPGGTETRRFSGGVFRDFNTIDAPSLKGYEAPVIRFVGEDWTRSSLAEAFPRKAEYDVKDALDFLRLNRAAGKSDKNYFELFTQGIDNSGTQQCAIFDPANGDILLGLAPSYAASQEIYRIYEDLAKKPTEEFAAEAIDPVDAELRNVSDKPGVTLADFVALTTEFPQSAQAAYVVAKKQLRAGDYENAAKSFERCEVLMPGTEDVGLFAILADIGLGKTDVAARRVAHLPAQLAAPNYTSLLLRYRIELASGAEAASLKKEYETFIAPYGFTPKSLDSALAAYLPKTKKK